MLWLRVVIFGAVLLTRSEGRSIGDFISSLHIHLPSDAFPPQPPLSPPSPFFPSSSKSTSKSSPPLPQCKFIPHPSSSSSSAASDFSIPTHAWPHISTLLTTNTENLLPPSPPDPFHRSRVHTLRLKDLIDDVSLEGVVVGLVYTAPEPSDQELELRDESSISDSNLKKKENELVQRRSSDRERFKYRGNEDSREDEGGEAAAGERDRKCLQEAIVNVMKERVMEGVLELSAGKGGRVGFLVYRVD